MYILKTLLPSFGLAAQYFSAIALATPIEVAVAKSKLEARATRVRFFFHLRILRSELGSDRQQMFCDGDLFLNRAERTSYGMNRYVGRPRQVFCADMDQGGGCECYGNNVFCMFMAKEPGIINRECIGHCHCLEEPKTPEINECRPEHSSCASYSSCGDKNCACVQDHSNLIIGLPIRQECLAAQLIKRDDKSQDLSHLKCACEGNDDKWKSECCPW